ncbi:hypothetical protein HYH02_002284 [Chlamydomonas schloesseri]|uniref:Uncharacterized protein n=1 Tax=Chlamydomonas schloesseri TaxID=2026947 RepID=A0A836BAT1_9CHLO|nr:hypothetical protein HYH02_002284 [Chlamydomonas schloesseri]|eukprot:KAG2452947.1 hypothetical protein HYH02_002284 [Chlamydomonas schloesseri]
MLLGDDDTLFSLPAVLGLLREMRLPHTEPLVVSDFLVANSTGDHANANADSSPATLPCRLPPNQLQPPRFRPHPDCSPEGRTSFYGGAGVILSHGLMQWLAKSHQQVPMQAAAAATVAADASFYAVTMSSFTAPPPLPYELPQHSNTQRQPCAGGSGAPPVPQCRRFGSLVGFNDEASPEAMVHRHRLAAEVSPEAFRRVVSAHLRQRKAKDTW